MNGEDSGPQAPTGWPWWSLWFGLAIATAATAFSFFTWASVTTSLNTNRPGMAGSAANAIEAESATAWESLPGAVAVLVLVAAGAVAAVPLPATWSTARWLSWFALTAIAIVFIVVDWATLPSVRDVMQQIADRFGVGRSTIQPEDVAAGARFIDIGPGIGLIACLVLAVLSLVGAVVVGRLAAKRTPAHLS